MFLLEKDKTVKTWMSMEAGGICWNISKLGQNLYKSTWDTCCRYTYQPGHEAYFYYQVIMEMVCGILEATYLDGVKVLQVGYGRKYL